MRLKPSTAVTLERGFRRHQPALPWAGQLGLGDHARLGLLRGQAHLPGCAHQRRLLPPHRRQAAPRHVPLRRISEARLGLRGGDGTADHGGGIRRLWARPCRSACSPPPPGPAAISASAARTRSRGAPLRHVHLLRRRLRRLVGGRRPYQRLLVRRHLEDPAGGDPGAALPHPVRGVCAAGRARAAPGATGAASA